MKGFSTHDPLIGKKAEKVIEAWLDQPDKGWDFNRIPDQMTGFYGSKNICDFDLFISPEHVYIESKATYEDRFEFSMLSANQYNGLLKKSRIPHVHGIVIVTFVTYRRVFAIPIQEIDKVLQSGKKSLNIKKLDTWGITYQELETLPSRKELSDLTGELDLNLI